MRRTWFAAGHIDAMLCGGHASRFDLLQDTAGTRFAWSDYPASRRQTYLSIRLRSVTSIVPPILIRAKCIL